MSETRLSEIRARLEAARERERALREAHERSVGVFRRACEIAEAAILAGETPETASARLRDAIEADIAEINALVALATPQEASDGDNTRKAVTDVVILIIESGLLREGVKVWEVDNLVRRIVARLTGRTVEQVAEVITEEILATPQEASDAEASTDT